MNSWMPRGSDSLLEYRGVQKSIQGGIITVNNTTSITLPQGFSFQWVTEAPSQPCWQNLSYGGEESINFAASQAELCLQPLHGCISNSCQLLLIMFTIIWDYTQHNLSCISLHCPAPSRGDISNYTGDSPSAPPEITTNNSTVFDLNPEQHTGQNHT